MDNSLRIQIILQINMTREKEKCLDCHAKQTRLDVRDAGPAVQLSTGMTCPHPKLLYELKCAGTFVPTVFFKYTHTHTHTHTHTVAP
jgi:hypothetical protein